MRKQVEMLEDHADLLAHFMEMPLVGRDEVARLLHVIELLAVDLDEAVADGPRASSECEGWSSYPNRTAR
jgi:spore cortex formation protein SpoVR/YcgB (stage V sporulation)